MGARHYLMMKLIDFKSYNPYLARDVACKINIHLR